MLISISALTPLLLLSGEIFQGRGSWYETENYSQFTTRIPNDMASPRVLLAMTLYSPASSGEHLKTKSYTHGRKVTNASFTKVPSSLRRPTFWSPVCWGQTAVGDCSSTAAQTFSEAHHSYTCSWWFDRDLRSFKNVFWRSKQTADFFWSLKEIFL